MTRTKLWPAARVAVAAGALAGCAVTPEALPPVALDDLAQTSIATVAANQEPIGAIVDLPEALARALKYKLDHRVEIAEHAVRERELNLAHYSMLPTIVTNSGYAARDRFAASNSENVFTGVESLATSTSQDRRLRSADAAFNWNILDFGLSYVRARQAADKVLIQNELRRKVTLRVLEETRAAYWRAASAQRLLGQLQRVERLARGVESDARTVAADKVASPITALTYEREIIEVQRVIGELQRELNTAHAQLAALINVSPGTRFRIAGAAGDAGALPSGSMQSLLHSAVMNRPELREAAYRKRINEQEAHAALLELLPGINLYAAGNFDSNSYLLHNHWQSWGAKASWNLLKVFSYPARRAVVEEQAEMLDRKVLAVTMAVMTQVYVSRIRYAHTRKEFRTAQRYRNVQRRLLEQIRAEYAADRISRQTLVREELNMLVAEARHDIAHASMQAALAFARSSMGLDPALPEDTSLSVRELSASLRAGSRPAHLAVAVNAAK